MKSTRWESKFIASVVCGLTALAAPSFADSWVTVNPDGSVTRTEVQGPQASTHQSYRAQAPVGIAAGKPSSGLSRGFESKPQTHTSSSHRRTRRYTTGPGRRDHSRTYPYPTYPSFPAYPTYPAPAPGYYSYPAPAYNGPIGPPMQQPFTSPWITSVPTIGTYYYTPSPYPPHVGYPAPAPAYPYYPPVGYGYGLPGHSSTTYGQVTLGGSGVSVTLGGSRSSSSTSTTTTTTVTR
jgi:hypothetical protein